MFIRLIKFFRKKIGFFFTHRIPSYDEKRAVIDSYRLRFGCTILVETGTFLGDTVAHFKDKVDKVYSIELSQELAERAAKRFANDRHISILQGDSSEVLSGILPQLNSPTLFWLDGHYSSEFFIGEEYFVTAKGETNTPIEKELTILLSIPKQIFAILIDDARLFTGRNDYPTLKKIKKMVAQSTTQYTVFKKNDIIHILPIS